jgi:hypothetical protein
MKSEVVTRTYGWPDSGPLVGPARLGNLRQSTAVTQGAESPLGVDYESPIDS